MIYTRLATTLRLLVRRGAIAVVQEKRTPHSHEARIATASYDGTATVAGGVIKLWDLSQVGQPDAEPIPLYGHTASGACLAFSPDGKRLATGSDDGTVRIYALDLGDLIGITKSRVTRTLTKDECQEYLHEQTCPPGP